MVVAKTAQADGEARSREAVFAPEDVFDSLTAAEFARSRQPLPPPSLKAKSGLQDLDLTGNPKTLFEEVAKRFGLEAVFDGDYPAVGPQIRFRIPGIDYREALHDLEAITSSFVVPLSPSLFIVAQDTPQKRNDLEQSIVVTVPVPEAVTAAQLTEIRTGRRTSHQRRQDRVEHESSGESDRHSRPDLARPARQGAPRGNYSRGARRS